jgi:hypothetical protein
MAADEINPERDGSGEPIWTVAGYMDWDGNYHDMQSVDWTEQGDDWFPETDLITIAWIDAEEGTAQYARLEGPFEDREDLEQNVETYFQEGTP